MGYVIEGCSGVVFWCGGKNNVGVGNLEMMFDCVEGWCGIARNVMKTGSARLS